MVCLVLGGEGGFGFFQVQDVMSPKSSAKCVSVCHHVSMRKWTAQAVDWLAMNFMSLNSGWTLRLGLLIRLNQIQQVCFGNLWFYNSLNTPCRLSAWGHSLGLPVCECQPFIYQQSSEPQGFVAVLATNLTPHVFDP